MFPAVFYELFQSLPRQGPGSNACTARAYQLLPNLPPRPKILDIGCGSGMQTLELARLSGGHITALDNHQPFLDTLAQNARATGLEKQIKTVNSSMFGLPFTPENFDLIWSEGAIFIIGFEKGLREWKPFLKQSGYLVVSELAWITPHRPEEISAYLTGEYPPIKNDQENEAVIRQTGYHLVSSFILPETAWKDEFYRSYQSRVNALKNKYAGDTEATEFLKTCQHEIDMYTKYSRYYSYVFYLMQN